MELCVGTLEIFFFMDEKEKMGEKQRKQGIRKRREEGAGGGSNEVAINVFWGSSSAPA